MMNAKRTANTLNKHSVIAKSFTETITPSLFLQDTARLLAAAHYQRKTRMRTTCNMGGVQQ